jgi:ribosome biogenesis GTPase
MKLQLAGWNESWAQIFAEHLNNSSDKALKPARVLAQRRHTFALWTETGEIDAEVAGALLYRADQSGLPAVGDWVAVRQYAPGDVAIITDILPRRTNFSRKVSGRAAEEQVIAANIDLLFIVFGLDHDYNLRRLERYLVAAGESKAETVIVLNKADLCPDVDARVAEVRAIAPGVPVAAISALSVATNDLLRYIASGQTAALVGSSGAGKSTIVNQMLGTSAQTTQPTRESDSRGRHTTTHRELFFLPNGGLILDNPGIRELQLWSQELRQGGGSSQVTAVDQTFPEIDALAEQCGFRDCTHSAEPNCAVLGALASGEIEDARWRSYLKLRRELKHAQTLVDPNLRRTEKERWKKLTSAVKRNQKRK